MEEARLKLDLLLPMEAGDETTGVFGRRMTPLSFSGLEVNVPELMLVYINLYAEYMRILTHHKRHVSLETRRVEGLAPGVNASLRGGRRCSEKLLLVTTDPNHVPMKNRGGDASHCSHLRWE